MTDINDEGTEPGESGAHSEAPEASETPGADPEPPRKTPTAVPPRGQKKKPSRPSSGRPGQKAGQRSGGANKAASGAAGRSRDSGGGSNAAGGGAKAAAGGAKASGGGTKPAGGGTKPAGGGTKPAGRSGQRTGANRRQAEWQARRRRNLTLAMVAVAVVVVVVGVLIGVKVASGGGSKGNSSALGSVSGPTSNISRAQAGVSNLPASASKVVNVPISALASASHGTTIAKLPSGKALSNLAPLTTNGKPTVLYIGAGFCPYCAAERWSLVAALSKFGTFTNLGSTASSSTDVNPNTPTFSFYQSTYSSPYIVFRSVEITTQDQNQHLESPTAAENALWKKLDSGQSIPFINFGNKYLITGATYDSSSMANKSFDSVAALVGTSSTAAAKGIDQAAGAMVKAICTMTNNQPANVCSAIGS